MSRRVSRRLSLALMACGAATLTWALLVWQWRDPFTSLYTWLEQRELSAQYEALAASHLRSRADLAATARRYRQQARRGDPIGRLRIERLELDIVLVNGTDGASLRKGPGRDRRSFLPGEGKLVYLAGHRTTYLAPFADIDRLRKGDLISIEVPYGTFTYAVTGHRVVEADDMSVLRSPERETLRLQACHPRFFASHRYIVFAKPLDG
jgi:sortase A